ncbi:MAG: PIG-L family deacetylase, partial [Dehalococcoidia bacterium]|nr:PIG-L family deacetylase [Dehalococcoidia bacterium]
GSNATPQTLGTVREAELRWALGVLGVRSSVLLGYRDSGMAGTEDNRHPSAFINAPVSEVLGRLVALIRKHRPQVVATMDLGGGYGHPDHIRASELTTQAFKTAGDPSYPFLSGDESWTPSKLYYHVFPRSRMVKWFNYLKENNHSSEIANLNPNTVGTPDEEISTVLEVSTYLDQRLHAAEQHRSQQSPFTMLPRELTNEALSKDFWVRAEPPWHGGEMETDLFEGI